MKRSLVFAALNLFVLPQAFSIALNRALLCEMHLRPTQESHAELESFFKELLAAQNLPSFTKFEGWQTAEEQQEHAYFWVSAEIDSTKQEKTHFIYQVDVKTFHAQTLFISSSVTAFNVHNMSLFLAFSKNITTGSEFLHEISLQSFSIPAQNETPANKALVSPTQHKIILTSYFHNDSPSISYQRIQEIKSESDRLLIKRVGHTEQSPREIYSY